MRKITIALAALAVALTACTPEEPTATTVTIGTNPIERPVPQAFSLVPFDACEDFLVYVKDHAVDLVTPWGLGGVPGPWRGDVFFEDFDVAIPATGAPEATGDARGRPSQTPGVDFSTTNVQEIGVDEPDIVKTDGRRIVALSEQTLYLIDVTGAEPDRARRNASAR